MSWRPLVGLTLVVLLVGVQAASAEPAFAKWAAVVIAGDWHAHSGGPSEAFDNARRDVAASLETIGFSAGNIQQYSVRPERYPTIKLEKADPRIIFEGLQSKASAASEGCLVYLTSHGAPQGAVLDQGLLPPPMLKAMIDEACPDRPTVVVVSACFSGVYVPALASRQRMILTAARQDRTSFGCGESDRYPYFDACFLESAAKASDFLALASATRRCVAARETETGANPPSEPQLWVGSALAPILPLYTFRRP